MRCKRNCIPVCAPSIINFSFTLFTPFTLDQLFHPKDFFFFFLNIVVACNVTQVSADKRLETNGTASQRCPKQWQKEMLLREHRWTQLPPVALSLLLHSGLAPARAVGASSLMSRKDTLTTCVYG